MTPTGAAPHPLPKGRPPRRKPRAALPIHLSKNIQNPPARHKPALPNPRSLLTALSLALTLASPANAEDALIAVATNFLSTAKTLETAFEEATGHEITLASGATGTLYAQITRGAPFDAFLAADTERPARLHTEGSAAKPVPYAIGTLTLWSADPARITGPHSVAQAPPRRFAIANPEVAPYGRAATEVIANLGWEEALASKTVRGENIGQAFAMIATGNAEMGLIATSALATRNTGSHWPVPPQNHSPIQQDAALTTRGQLNPAATAFLAFLTSPPGRAIIAAQGYLLPPRPGEAR